jgi:hypothetical protein
MQRQRRFSGRVATTLSSAVRGRILAIKGHTAPPTSCPLPLHPSHAWPSRLAPAGRVVRAECHVQTQRKTKLQGEPRRHWQAGRHWQASRQALGRGTVMAAECSKVVFLLCPAPLPDLMSRLVRAVRGTRAEARAEAEAESSLLLLQAGKGQTRRSLTTLPSGQDGVKGGPWAGGYR